MGSMNLAGYIVKDICLLVPFETLLVKTSHNALISCEKCHDLYQFSEIT